MSHRVTVVGTEDTFEVEEDESILGAALRVGINWPHDCKSGTCGTCRFRPIEGKFTYREEPMGLSPEEEAEGYALACQARPETDILADAEILPPDRCPPQRHSATVCSVEMFSRDVMHLTLELPAAPIDYRPGQYINVLIGDGRERSFSMASAPNGRTVDFHVRRIPGGRFTEATLPNLAEGEPLDVELPHGSFFLRKDDFRPLLMVATGTGLAPIKSILESLMDDPDCPPVSLYWGMRTAADLYLHDQIRTWNDRLCEFRYVPVLSRGDADWQGRRGYVQHAASEDIEDLSDYAIYLCGSPEMVRAAKSQFIGQGASINHIYSDSFFFQHNLGAR